MRQPIHVLLGAVDWRFVARSEPSVLLDKLRRDRLEPDRNRVTIATWAPARYESSAGQNVRVFGRRAPTRFKPALDFLSLFTLPAAARRVRPDVVATYDLGFLPAAWLAARFSGARCLYLVNNMPARYSRSRRFGAVKGAYSWVLERLLARLPDAVMTINPAMRDYLINFGVPPERISMFSMDTIARDAAHIRVAEKGKMRAELGIPAGTKVVLAVARLEAEKSYPRLLDAFAGMPEGYALVIAGEGSLRPALEAQVARLDLGRRVYLPGSIPREKIWDYYADADCFVLLSREEALGVVFWEAMHAGVPAVGSEAPGIIESIGADESRGLLFTSDRPLGEFPAVIREAIEGSRRAERVAAARSYVAEMTANALTVNDVIAPRRRRALFLYNAPRDRADFEKIEQGEMHDGNYFGMRRLRALGWDTDFAQVEDALPAGLCRLIRRHLPFHFVHLPLMLLPRFWRADAIVTGGALGALVAWAAWPLPKPRWVQIDFNLAGTIGECRTFRERVLRGALGRASHVLCIAEAEVAELVRRVPALGGRASFAREGVDLDFFAPVSGAAREPNLFASVGADRNRDFALAVLAARAADVRLEIGAPERHVVALGALPPNISARPLSHVEVRNLYRRAAAAVVVFRTTGPADSMGTLSVIEAMASGLAVIATDCPSVRSYIEPEVSGLLVPEGDLPALSEALRRIAGDSALASRLGSAARAAAESGFGADRFATEIDRAARALSW